MPYLPSINLKLIFRNIRGFVQIEGRRKVNQSKGVLRMNEVLTFLTQNPIFYLATVEGAIPKVRPFGFVMVYEGKLYFATSNQKPVYKQLKANPHLEVSTTSKAGEWLRLQGKAVFHTNQQTKQAALDTMPMLRNRYSVDDSIFELFYVEEAMAVFNDMTGASRTIKW